MKTERTELQRERQSYRYRTGGKYAKVNPCYVCGKSAGVHYYSDRRTDTGEFDDIALVLCGKCAEKGEAMSDADALKFYQAGVMWRPRPKVEKPPCQE